MTGKACSTYALDESIDKVKKAFHHRYDSQCYLHLMILHRTCRSEGSCLLFLFED